MDKTNLTQTGGIIDYQIKNIKFHNISYPKPITISLETTYINHLKETTKLKLKKEKKKEIEREEMNL